MAGYVHVKGGKSVPILAFFSGRKIKAKVVELFSINLLVFMAVTVLFSSLLFVNSYYKSCLNAQSVRISTHIDRNRELGFKMKELETKYLKMTSSKALVTKARELGLEVATKDKILNFN